MIVRVMNVMISALVKPAYMKVQFFLYDTEASHLFIRIECA